MFCAHSKRVRSLKKVKYLSTACLCFVFLSDQVDAQGCKLLNENNQFLKVVAVVTFSTFL